MKNERGITLIEVLFCVALMTITLLGTVKVKNRIVQNATQTQHRLYAYHLANKQLQSWQLCGVNWSTSASLVNVCTSFDEIVANQKNESGYAIKADVTPLILSNSGQALLKSVHIEVSWYEGKGNKRKVEVSSLFSRLNPFFSPL
ncbi:type IV pilus modification PilV family protein [Vibrio viridaestus]|uniref:Prepilin-type N-terminal cleavage/methylation domain-containing protein n=1 Tax=Vibrio viridaestus TaxID=2487322 RepID=A0A3N9TDW2_9VIBR|nr:prepilin-type N-terminal cleavage/methylation domain-containing protein [Vibrio viridaestus]RQW62408.1 hypothetical protein EES38_14630 [Vibrio viridaestus]